MDPISDGVAVVKALKMGKEIFDYLKGRTKSTEEVTKLQELQDVFGRLRDENARLQDENARLRQELQEYQEKADGRNAYEERQVGDGVVLVRIRSDGTDGPPCCPTCVGSNGKPLPLQAFSASFQVFGSHKCIQCDGTFQLK